MLLDEPTNHLDLDGIALLEDLLRQQPASIVITHDRMFLDRVTTRIVELDRGLLRSYPGNFAAYEARKADELSAEAIANRKFDAFWKQEEAWIRKGVEARRTRDMGRVRQARATARASARHAATGCATSTMALQAAERSGKLVAELEGVGKRFGERVVVRDLDLRDHARRPARHHRPERRGQVHAPQAHSRHDGAGCGSASGTERSCMVAYFDQMREQLDEERTLADTISPGGEWIETGRRPQARAVVPRRVPVPAAARECAGQDALRRRAQPPAARAPVRAAGQPARARRADQRSRHRIARDPRRDAAVVCGNAPSRQPRPRVPRQRRDADAGGEGDGRWKEYVGGYSDWVAQRPRPSPRRRRRPTPSHAHRRARASVPRSSRSRSNASSTRCPRSSKRSEQRADRARRAHGRRRLSQAGRRRDASGSRASGARSRRSSPRSSSAGSSSRRACPRRDLSTG